MVATTLAGIELMGGLISKHKFRTEPRVGSNCFHNYWNQILVKENTKYKGLGSIFRRLVRNGIMHTFLAKNGILVTKNHPHLRHLDLDTKEKLLVIDCIVFYNRFDTSYFNRKKSFGSYKVNCT